MLERESQGPKLFSVGTENATRGNGHKLQIGKCGLDRKKNSLGGHCSTRADSYHCFLKETEKSPSSRVFKAHPDKAKADLVWHC